MDSSSAQTRAPGYMIIEYEITDQAEFREYLKASAALRATGLKTKRAVVELGLQRLVQLSGQERIRELRGTVHWEGDLRKMRNAE